MKNLIILSVLAFLIFPVINAQTVDEILAEHFAVIGQEKLLQTNTFSTKGKIMQGQFEIPFISLSRL